MLLSQALVSVIKVHPKVIYNILFITLWDELSSQKHTLVALVWNYAKLDIAKQENKKCSACVVLIFSYIFIEKDTQPILFKKLFFDVHSQN